MTISAIVAVTENDVINRNGKIPWKMPADFSHMIKITKGHPILMGRKTHEYVGRRALPNRINVVLSRNPEYKVPADCLLAYSIEEALNLDEVKNANKIFAFGGDIYKAMMPMIQKIYLTRIHAVIPGTAFFKYNPKQWIEVSREAHQKDDRNPYDYDFIVLERKNP